MRDTPAHGAYHSSHTPLQVVFWVEIWGLCDLQCIHVCQISLVCECVYQCCTSCHFFHLLLCLLLRFNLVDGFLEG